MRRKTLLFLAGAAALFSAFFSWEWYLSPRAQVVRTLEKAGRAAERKDLPLLLSFFSADYSDFRRLNKSSLEEILSQGFSQIDRLNVTLEGIRVDVESEQAAAALDLTVVAVRGEERLLLVGTLTEPEKIRVELRREPEGWKIVRVGRRES